MKVSGRRPGGCTTRVAVGVGGTVEVGVKVGGAQGVSVGMGVAVGRSWAKATGGWALIKASRA